MTMMIRIIAMMAAVVGRSVMHVLVAAIVGRGKTIAAIMSMSQSIAAIAMAIMTIAKAVDAALLRLLFAQRRLQLSVRHCSSCCCCGLNNGRQAARQAHGQHNEDTL